ncbi:hypothetical protein SAMN06265784_102633 [Paraburkholderia susongensis]|uniref:Uncharacterized protein n=1 Tax=Paraburkholderia susongensis TaxID=1515439 RepID=A0A1X7JJH7_9BURK|nr:hypothetical protein SAMN06265784_102633 [Paraburkholderia susongensis]
MDPCGRCTNNRADAEPEEAPGLIPDFERRGGLRLNRSENIVVHALRGPCEQALVVLEPRELGFAPLGEHGDVDGRMKTRRRRNGALPNGVHQA